MKMSVLNQSGEEQVECPLCMEPLEVDDLNFYPCTCGYQICRFCWHRIRTDENGLCPACRKAYSEDPADFIPLSKEQVAKLKADKRHRDQQRKAKLSENRKHLASVRVVQRNLVFVVGLPIRLAEAELLKKHEYFGKFGKIHKVVINQSTSYAGSQGPSASAYVTYMRSEDALRAIQSVNNIVIDGRLIKSSLGTTKYCSHFMKNQPCPKPDCMYLHDFGDPEASFTKEEMHAGKHQEYEKKLHDALQRQNVSPTPATQSNGAVGVPANDKKEKKDGSPPPASNNTKDNWPQLDKTDGVVTKRKNGKKVKGSPDNSLMNLNDSSTEEDKSSETSNTNCDDDFEPLEHTLEDTTPPLQQHQSITNTLSATEHNFQRNRDVLDKYNSSIFGDSKLLSDNTSFFSQGFQTLHNGIGGAAHELEERTTCHDDNESGSTVLLDSFPTINTSEDWAAAFGFGSHEQQQNHHHHHHLDELSKQATRIRQPLKDPLDGLMLNNGFPQFESSRRFYEKENSILDSIGTNKNNGYKEPNGLDQNMSKFFLDFHKGQNGQLNMLNGINSLLAPPQTQNGYYAQQQQQQQSVLQERLLLLQQQKQLEEQLMNLNLKQQAFQLHNGFNTFGGTSAPRPNLYMPELSSTTAPPPTTSQAKVKSLPEDELDFDPIQVTQKALEELIATEKNHNKAGGSTSQRGVGVVNQLPPPPPGFMQPNAHMNSFGSKILPFLNMSNSSTNQTWPTANGYVNPHTAKNITSNVNDWKNLDPAILSSSRHYPMPNNSYNAGAPQTTQQSPPGGQPQQLRQSYMNGTTSTSSSEFSATTNYGGYNHLHQPPNWYTHNSEGFTTTNHNTTTSPPGFRNSQQTKQQEC